MKAFGDDVFLGSAGLAVHDTDARFRGIEAVKIPGEAASPLNSQELRFRALGDAGS